jgi:arylsulfatase A
VLPTLCAAAGVPLVADRVIDGQNILPAIQTGREMEHVDIAYYQGNTLNALRHGDWKLHVRRQNGLSRFTGLVDWSPTAELPQLFHLGRDPEEYYDVSERYPDVLSDMQNRLAAFDTALKADRAARYGS